VLVLPTLPVRIVKAAILQGGAVSFQQTDARLSLTLPPTPPDAVDTVIRLELAEPWITSAVVPVPKL
jgi:hypothetical protein